MNDTHVRSVSQKTALGAQAYVLFYVRADITAQPAGQSIDRGMAAKAQASGDQNDSLVDSLKLKSEKLQKKWAAAAESKGIEYRKSTTIFIGELH